MKFHQQMSSKQQYDYVAHFCSFNRNYLFVHELTHDTRINNIFTIFILNRYTQPQSHLYTHTRQQTHNREQHTHTHKKNIKVDFSLQSSIHLHFTALFFSLFR